MLSFLSLYFPKPFNIYFPILTSVCFPLALCILSCAALFRPRFLLNTYPPCPVQKGKQRMWCFGQSSRLRKSRASFEPRRLLVILGKWVTYSALPTLPPTALQTINRTFCKDIGGRGKRSPILLGLVRAIKAMNSFHALTYFSSNALIFQQQFEK